FLLSLVTTRGPPRSPLFPYTTLFRSHPAEPRARRAAGAGVAARGRAGDRGLRHGRGREGRDPACHARPRGRGRRLPPPLRARGADRKSTRLNSSHVAISYAVFCLKKK